MTRRFNDQELVRRKKLEELQNQALCPYSIESIDVNYSVEEILKLDESWINEINCAGRILFTRQTFFVITENNSRLQIYIDIKKEKGKALHNYFKKYIDIGDYVFVSGILFKTKTGMLTLRASKLQIISKSLKPLPEKHHGITNSELLVRNRVGSLITNPNIFNILKLRSEILFEIRNFLNHLGYIEFETPILHKIAGGANARPFQTYHNTFKENLYLRVAPELYLKRLIISGFTKVYEIGRSFRNEGVDNSHNPEFSSIEIYTSYFGLKNTMELTEKIISHIYSKFYMHCDIKNTKLSQFKKVAIWELILEKTGVDFYAELISLDCALQLANKYGISLKDEEKTTAQIYEKLFEILIAPDLKEPTFVFGFSSELSPLAKRDPKNDFFALRFELYIDGKEIANGFSEQNNPMEQESQFLNQINENSTDKNIDSDYISCLEYGLPPTGGVGIGIDRLVMFILNQTSIKNVIAFPYLKG